MKSYTKKAKKALDIANRISKSMNYNYVGTEHLLVGLLKEGSGVAAEVLSSNGVELDKLIQMIKELISPGEDVLVADRDGMSPRTQMVVNRAEEEAERFDSEEIGTEHLLLALLTEGDCAASRLLNTMEINVQKLIMDTITAMGENPAKYREELQKGRKSPQGAVSTPTLDQYSRDLTEMAREGCLDPVVGRKVETDRVIQILCRRGNNNTTP